MDASEILRAVQAQAEAMQTLAEEHKGFRSQLLELAQRNERAPGSDGHGGGSHAVSEMARAIVDNEGVKLLLQKRVKDVSIPISVKTLLQNATGTAQPLVPPDYQGEIIYAPPQVLRVRDLIPALPTSSNIITWPSEATFTNAAAPQGDVSPVGTGEGEIFGESAFSFTLNQLAVPTYGSWVPASMQILSDAVMLQDHIGSRLIYGLNLAEDTDMLTGTGGANTHNGLCNQASAFTGGVTNATLLDTLSRAKEQLATNNFTADGVVLNPADFGTLERAQDTQGRYILGDPAAATSPRAWGVRIAVSQGMPVGKFLMGAFNQAARIFDLQEAMVELSTSHSDYFTRGLVAIRCWRRSALAVMRSTALVYGNTSHAG